VAGFEQRPDSSTRGRRGIAREQGEQTQRLPVRTLWRHSWMQLFVGKPRTARSRAAPASPLATAGSRISRPPADGEVELAHEVLKKPISRLAELPGHGFGRADEHSSCSMM